MSPDHLFVRWRAPNLQDGKDPASVKDPVFRQGFVFQGAQMGNTPQLGHRRPSLLQLYQECTK